MCLWPSADSSKNGDPNPDFYRLLFLALDLVARQIPVPGPFYRAFRHEFGDFMMFKDNHGNEFRVMLIKVGNNAFFFEGFRSMVAAYNIRHGAWLRAYYEDDDTLCISIRNLDRSYIVYPRLHSRSKFTAPTLKYTPPTSLVRSNAFDSPQYSTNSLGCPVYFALTTSQASLVGQVDLGSRRRSLSPPVA
ncbi:B3 domain-containing transcription factor [Arachis hypogaea]|nr:B3 domain-containing transcription factor [Arachis hypogaea]